MTEDAELNCENKARSTVFFEIVFSCAFTHNSLSQSLERFDILSLNGNIYHIVSLTVVFW